MTVEEFLGLVLVAFAGYRIARLVADDLIMSAPRKRVAGWAFKPIRFGDPDEVELTEEQMLTMDPRTVHKVARSPWRGFVGDLVTCQLCVGVYFTAALFWLWRTVDDGSVWRALVAMAAAVGMQALISTRPGA